MQKKSLAAMAATVGIVVATLAPTEAFALSSRTVTANKNYVTCLVNAFSAQAGKQRVTKSTLERACTSQEKAYYDAVYNEKPGIITQYKRNNANAAVRNLKRNVFRAFGV